MISLSSSKNVTQVLAKNPKEVRQARSLDLKAAFENGADSVVFNREGAEVGKLGEIVKSSADDFAALTALTKKQT